VSFTAGIIENNIEKTLSNLVILKEKWVDVRLFLEQIFPFLRDRMVENLSKPEFTQYNQLFEMFEEAYGKLKFVPDTFLLLETSVLRYMKLPKPNTH
jgi:deoxyadenosine/deoxycytidine kinase